MLAVLFALFIPSDIANPYFHYFVIGFACGFASCYTYMLFLLYNMREND